MIIKDIHLSFFDKKSYICIISFTISLLSLMKKPLFVVELVPKTCFFTNVRSQVSGEAWDWLRRETYKQANHRCEGCGTKGRMEAHEIWHYDDVNHIQKLHGLSAYCNLCHLSHHLGYASVKGKLPEVKKHLTKIHQWSALETDLYIEGVFEIWFRRSQHQWSLDLTFLDQCGITYTTISPNERANKGSLL